MLKWMFSERKGSDAYNELYQSVTEGIQSCYREKILPLETSTLFHQCYAPRLTDADFAAKPMVLLMGQYSTGKSSFIRHLLERDYPGLRIGPEPTTDKFVTVMNGKTDRVIPGNALVVDNQLPFTQLANFGNNFLQRLECVQLSNPILEGLTFIDTPGVLSGEKQRLQRGYDFEGVIKWFADRSDMVILLFDAHKLDISDEFKRCIHQLKGNDTKIRIVLNKADRISTQQLMRVYGALMWALGKIIHTPEVARVYLGSFWDEPLHNDEQRRLFEKEENDLYTAIASLPRNAATRQLNDLIKRARLLRVHAYLMDHFRKEMPSLWGKQSKQKDLIKNLGNICQDLSKKQNLPLGDFPNVQALQRRLMTVEFAKIPLIDSKQITSLQKMLERDVQKLMRLIPSEALLQPSNAKLPFQSADPSPFAVSKENGLTEQSYLTSHFLENPPDVRKYEREFLELVQKGGEHGVGCTSAGTTTTSVNFQGGSSTSTTSTGGPSSAERVLGSEKTSPAQAKIHGHQAKQVLEVSKLNSAILHKIWTLADIDRDGKLTLYEFALTKHFVEMKLAGLELPSVLPENFVAAAALEHNTVTSSMLLSKGVPNGQHVLSGGSTPSNIGLSSTSPFASGIIAPAGGAEARQQYYHPSAQGHALAGTSGQHQQHLQKTASTDGSSTRSGVALTSDSQIQQMQRDRAGSGASSQQSSRSGKRPGVAPTSHDALSGA